jgi:hypothetical protein
MHGLRSKTRHSTVTTGLGRSVADMYYIIPTRDLTTTKRSAVHYQKIAHA